MTKPRRPDVPVAKQEVYDEELSRDTSSSSSSSWSVWSSPSFWRRRLEAVAAQPENQCDEESGETSSSSSSSSSATSVSDYSWSVSALRLPTLVTSRGTANRKFESAEDQASVFDHCLYNSVDLVSCK